MTVEELIGRIVVSLSRAENLESSLSSEVLEMEGMSSPKVRHFLNNICSYGGVKYLEVGTASGSTFISAMKNNSPEYVCASDLWVETKNGKDGKQKFLENCRKYLGFTPQDRDLGNNFSLFTGDCFSLDKSLIKDRFNVYFFDGGHEIEDHRNSMIYFNDVMEDRFIMIIDDWNDDRVQKGTIAGLQESGLKIRFSHYCTARVNSTPPHWGDMNEWWNGLMILVLEKN
jgi:hypothetical protein